jgi:hypothetical protein
MCFTFSNDSNVISSEKQKKNSKTKIFNQTLFTVNDFKNLTILK